MVIFSPTWSFNYDVFHFWLFFWFYVQIWNFFSVLVYLYGRRIYNFIFFHRLKKGRKRDIVKKFMLSVNSRSILETFLRRSLIIIATKFVSLVFLLNQIFAFMNQSWADFIFLLTSEVKGKANRFIPVFFTIFLSLLILSCVVCDIECHTFQKSQNFPLLVFLTLCELIPRPKSVLLCALWSQCLQKKFSIVLLCPSVVSCFPGYFLKTDLRRKLHFFSTYFVFLVQCLYALHNSDGLHFQWKFRIIYKFQKAFSPVISKMLFRFLMFVVTIFMWDYSTRPTGLNVAGLCSNEVF